MEKIKNHLQPIIAAVSLVALFFLPFVDCSYGYGISNNFSGFIMAMNTYIGYLVVLLPVVLIGRLRILLLTLSSSRRRRQRSEFFSTYISEIKILMIRHDSPKVALGYLFSEIQINWPAKFRSIRAILVLSSCLLSTGRNKIE